MTQVTYTDAGWMKEDPDFECYESEFIMQWLGFFYE